MNAGYQKCGHIWLFKKEFTAKSPKECRFPRSARPPATFLISNILFFTGKIFCRRQVQNCGESIKNEYYQIRDDNEPIRIPMKRKCEYQNSDRPQKKQKLQMNMIPKKMNRI